MQNLIKDCTSFVQGKKRPLVVVLGPTASGKTGLSIELAKVLDGEIISTDSRQIYRKMPISTALISESEKENIPHHMLEIRDPDESITLQEYQEMVEKIIEDIYSRSKIPVLVGGTGLYISSIIESYSIPKSEPDQALRNQLTKEAQNHGSEYLHQKLERIDPIAASKIHPNNIPYLIRAIEINLLTGNNKSDKKSKVSKYDTYLASISWPRETLYNRINNRVENLFNKGIVDEVKALLNFPYSKKLPSMSSVGIKEIIPYIEGEITLEESKELLKRNTRRYAKRQMTWFRRYDKVHTIQKS